MSHREESNSFPCSCFMTAVVISVTKSRRRDAWQFATTRVLIVLCLWINLDMKELCLKRMSESVLSLCVSVLTSLFFNTF